MKYRVRMGVSVKKGYGIEFENGKNSENNGYKYHFKCEELN